MSIKIPAKFGSKLPPEDSGSGGVNFANLLQKRKLEKEQIKPVLGDLFALYHHYCAIFISGKCVGSGYGIYSDNRDSDYDEIGKILANL
ncbi:hypothetical protein [Anabaena azotica]|uniref:Uncharacterized protein n=1 Tax=Anabaena azotica FACHB-119 TaxID=947527 RepID=A0ABR8CY60_9NOST|nr:hypothetical protein [Anabaena azotica]MBD2499869.1 hypothetical protein [Anabaena azotica FACHB-119]